MVTKRTRRVALGQEFLFGLVLSGALLLSAAQSFANAMPQGDRSDRSDPFASFKDSLSQAADDALREAQNASPASTHERVAPRFTTDPQFVDTEMLSTERYGFRSNATSRRFPTQRESFGPFLASILREEGVPEQLAAVVQVESGGRSDALSPKGARGLWQLMPATAQQYGLRVGWKVDDRLDMVLATRAAARYLRDLYRQFGDWQLALAAYNSGEQMVESAIVRAGSPDFALLSARRLIPEETRNYVPAVLRAAGWLGVSTQQEKRTKGSSVLDKRSIVFAPVDIRQVSAGEEPSEVAAGGRR